MAKIPIKFRVYNEEYLEVRRWSLGIGASLGISGIYRWCQIELNFKDADGNYYQSVLNDSEALEYISLTKILIFLGIIGIIIFLICSYLSYKKYIDDVKNENRPSDEYVETLVLALLFLDKALFHKVMDNKQQYTISDIELLCSQAFSKCTEDEKTHVFWMLTVHKKYGEVGVKDFLQALERVSSLREYGDIIQKYVDGNIMARCKELLKNVCD